MGGLAIPIFTNLASQEYANSVEVTAQLTQNILDQKSEWHLDTAKFKQSKHQIEKHRNEEKKALLSELKARMSDDCVRAIEISSMKGASAWITILPLQSEKFALNKREFFDSVKLRSRWPLKYVPSMCPCGKNYSVDHAMSCAKRGFMRARHDELRDVIGNLLSEVCNDVAIEPHLTPVTGENLPRSSNTGDDARLDVSARGFWQRGQRAFFDVRVFNPFAPSHLKQNLQKVFTAN